MILTAETLRKSFGREHVFGPMLNERYFTIPTDYLVNEFLPFWIRLKKKINLTYIPNKTDCDAFAIIFKAEVLKASISLKVDAAAAIGIAHVTNIDITMGIGIGNHMLNTMVVTDGDKLDWLMLDPITDEFTKLQNYNAHIYSLSI